MSSTDAKLKKIQREHAILDKMLEEQAKKAKKKAREDAVQRNIKKAELQAFLNPKKAAEKAAKKAAANERKALRDAMSTTKKIVNLEAQRKKAEDEIAKKFVDKIHKDVVKSVDAATASNAPMSKMQKLLAGAMLASKNTGSKDVHRAMERVNVKPPKTPKYMQAEDWSVGFKDTTSLDSFWADDAQATAHRAKSAKLQAILEAQIKKDAYNVKFARVMSKKMARDLERSASPNKALSSADIHKSMQEFDVSLRRRKPGLKPYDKGLSEVPVEWTPAKNADAVIKVAGKLSKKGKKAGSIKSPKVDNAEKYLLDKAAFLAPKWRLDVSAMRKLKMEAVRSSYRNMLRFRNKAAYSDYTLFDAIQSKRFPGASALTILKIRDNKRLWNALVKSLKLLATYRVQVGFFSGDVDLHAKAAYKPGNPVAKTQMVRAVEEDTALYARYKKQGKEPALRFDGSKTYVEYNKAVTIMVREEVMTSAGSIMKAYLNEFGDPTNVWNGKPAPVPSRPFMRSGIDTNIAKIQADIKLIFTGHNLVKIHPRKLASTIGQRLYFCIFNRIKTASSWAEPNAPLTQERKENRGATANSPLLDTQRMLRGLTYRVWTIGAIPKSLKQLLGKEADKIDPRHVTGMYKEPTALRSEGYSVNFSSDLGD